MLDGVGPACVKWSFPGQHIQPMDADSEPKLQELRQQVSRERYGIEQLAALIPRRLELYGHRRSRLPRTDNRFRWLALERGKVPDVLA